MDKTIAISSRFSMPISGRSWMAIVLDRSLRNGVNPSRVPGVASKYSLQTQISAASSAEFIDRLAHIFGARRVESTGQRQDRRNNDLIGPDQSHRQKFHPPILPSHAVVFFSSTAELPRGCLPESAGYGPWRPPALRLLPSRSGERWPACSL